VLVALLPGRRIEFAGLAERDLTAFGGQRVQALAAAARQGPAHLVQVGGELLTCTAYQAAVMLREPAGAAAAIARYDSDPSAAAAWAARQLGTARSMPYIAGRDAMASPGRLIFNAVGGVEWASLAASQRGEALAALRSADWLSVRDHFTQTALQAEGVEAKLCPDPAVMVAECFGDRIDRHRQQGEPAEITRLYPQGYLACQFSNEFADEVTLTELARALGNICAESGLGLVLFRAGTAPWHDSLDAYERLRAMLPPGRARVFRSLHLWDICALIAGSQGFCGSSLHGRIVALAYGLPRVSLIAPQQGERPSKTVAFAETWEPEDLPGGVVAAALEPALRRVLGLPANALRQTAAGLCDLYRASQAQWSAMLED
jgi:hypothetical protein